MKKLNEKLSLRAGWLSIFANLVLFIIKFWAGIVSGSVAIIADSWHTLSDSLSSVFVLFGVWLSRKPADKEHPFGHGRYELIATILIGCLLAMVSYSFLMESIERLKNQESANYGIIALVVTILSVVAKEGLAQYAFYIARKTKSSSVHADGWHHRSDALSSVIILVGIFLGRFYWWIDGVLGIIVAILILYTAVMIIKNSSHTILGEKPTPELKKTINDLCHEAASINVYAHHLHIHNYINHKELTFHIYLPDSMSISEAHDITTDIEQKIETTLEIDATIHVEPISLIPIDNDKNV